MTAEVLPIRKFTRPEVLEPLVIGALLNNGPHLAGMLQHSGITEDSFSSQFAKMVWRLVSGLVASKKGVSALEVISAGRLRKAFGPADEERLQKLELENVVAPEQLRQVLEDLRRARRAVALAGMLRETAEKTDRNGLVLETVWETLAGVRKVLQEEAPDGSATDDLVAHADAWDANEKAGKRLLVPTGIRLLDEMVGGFPHSLTVIGGEPGAGKTGVIASIIRAQLAADSAMRIGVFGLEDGTSWLVRRWLAADTGMLLREVGWKQRTAEQRTACEASAEASFPSLSRVVTYRHNRIRIPELIRIATGWKAVHDVACIYIDNASQLQLRGGGKFEPQPYEALAEGLEELRQFAIDHKVAVVLLSHTNEDQHQRKPGPPKMSSMRGGRAPDQKARLMLGLWKKNSSWRCTMLKGNELAEAGETIEFERIPTAGLIVPDGGKLVDLNMEAAEEKRDQSERKQAEADAQRAKRKAEADARKAKAKAEAEEAAKPPQATLPMEDK